MKAPTLEDSRHQALVATRADQVAGAQPGRMGPRLPHLVQLGLLAAAYYAVGKLGLHFGALAGNVTPVWPPTGLAIGALLLFGRRLWPGVALGALLVNGLSPVPLGVAVGMAAGNTLEALVAAALVKRCCPADPIERVGGILLFSLLAGATATLISASVGVASLRAGGVIPPEAAWSTWRVWWVGDALGALVVAPAMLAAARATSVLRNERDRLEAAALVVATGLCTAVAFHQRNTAAYVVFPLLAWAALRFRTIGATAATLVITCLAVARTSAGHGSFANGNLTENLWALDLFLAVVALTGLILAAVVAERDRATSENERLTAVLRDRVDELQVANAELEAFTYTVSHDLRAPLRSIDGFSRMVLKNHAGSLGPDGQRHLEVVRRNARSMGMLIDELLGFSRLQRQELRCQPVDISALVEEVVASCRAEQPDRLVQFEVGALPPQNGDRAMLTQVFANLIGNAVKFSRDRSPARVEVGSFVDPARPGPVFFVRDNGAGFEMAYVDKLFGVFQRLHRQEDFEGTGVGLAIVERIVTRHGGQVWAEGAPGEGATIYFTLQGESA